MSAPHGSAHRPRPTDLVALVTFNGQVYENQAVTRERLALPDTKPHLLSTVIQQWLGLRRRTWIDVRGRQIDGVATARELSSHRAWMIETLIDASDDGEGVTAALLRQVIEAAASEQATHVLLRTPVDGPALADAVHAGFKHVLTERLWTGERLGGPAGATGGAARDISSGDIEVRKTGSEDAFALFQLYHRALPIDCRQALAPTLEEWRATQERRWLGRGGHECVASEGERISARLRLTLSGGVGQLDLLTDHAGAGAGAALLDVAEDLFACSEQALALVPTSAAPVERLLRERGLEPRAEYALLSKRTAQAVPERARAPANVAISGG